MKKKTSKVEPEGGTCCACGYKGKEEITCPVRSKRNKGVDDSCCNCWWDGTDEDNPSDDN